MSGILASGITAVPLSGLLSNPLISAVNYIGGSSYYPPEAYACGSISSGVIDSYYSGWGYTTPSGPIPSGFIRYTCKGCGKFIGLTGGPTITVHHYDSILSGHLFTENHFCFNCAPYDWKTDSFETREKWIKEGVPFSPETPDAIIADYLEEQGRRKDADYMRSLRSSR